MQKIFRKQKGITLVEVLLYLAIFALIFIGIVEFFLFVDDANKKAAEKIEVQEAALLIDEHFKSSLTHAVSLDEVNSLFDNPDGKITLTTSTGSLSYSKVNSDLVVERGAEANNINPKAVLITSLTFQKVTEPKGETVGIHMSVTLQSTKNSNLTQTYESSYLIGEY